MIRTTLVVVAACALAAAPTRSQSVEVPTHRQQAKRIIEEVLRHGRAYANLEELCRVAPKRLAGSPGAAAAVEWARQTMITDGLENVRLEPVMVPHWVRGDREELRVVAGAGVGLSLPIAALGGSVGTPVDGITAEVIEVGSIAQLRAMGAAAKGKIVFFNQPMDRTVIQTFQAYGGAVRQRSRGAVEAAKVGAVAAIIRSVTTRLDDAPHTGAMGYEDGVEQVPAAAVSTLGAERLSRMAARGPVSLHLELSCRWLADEPSANVVGELIGREHPEQIIVVGGHLDAWDLGEGAHDDGAGCVQSLEVVRTLKALELRPRRTIRVVLFMNEENGVRGGAAYYERYRDAMEHHVMALESDRGGFTPRGFTTDANAAALAIIREVGDLLVNVGGDKVIAGDGGVDIGPMRESGVPLVGFLPDCHRYFDLHHSKYDTFDQVNERELLLGAACMTTLCYVIADRPETLPRNSGSAPRGR